MAAPLGAGANLGPSSASKIPIFVAPALNALLDNLTTLVTGDRSLASLSVAVKRARNTSGNATRRLRRSSKEFARLADFSENLFQFLEDIASANSCFSGSLPSYTEQYIGEKNGSVDGAIGNEDRSRVPPFSGCSSFVKEEEPDSYEQHCNESGNISHGGCVPMDDVETSGARRGDESDDSGIGSSAQPAGSMGASDLADPPGVPLTASAAPSESLPEKCRIQVVPAERADSAVKVKTRLSPTAGASGCHDAAPPPPPSPPPPACLFTDANVVKEEVPDDYHEDSHHASTSTTESSASPGNSNDTPDTAAPRGRAIRRPARFADTNEEWEAPSLRRNLMSRSEAVEQVKRTRIKTSPEDEEMGGEFACCHCEKTFKTNQGRSTHSYRAHGMRKEKDTSTPRMRMQKVDGKMYRLVENGLGEQCSVCSSIFVGKSALSKHIKREHKEHEGPFFSCDLCERKYRTYDPLKKHMRMRHGIGTVSSGISPHTTGPVETCPICNLQFKGYYRLSNHITIEHKGTTIKHFKCDLCDMRFRTADIMRNHRKKHAKNAEFSCTLCTLSFTSHMGLCTHQTQCHGGILPEVRAMRPPRPANRSCPLCPEMFDSNRSLSAHFMSAHKDSDITPFKCDVCLVPYKSWLGMKGHRRSAHGPKKPSSTHKFDCDMCERRFKKWEGLRSHQNIVHGGMSQYGKDQISKRDYGVKCPICDAFYQGKHCLSEHLSRDHKDFNGRIFGCKICGRAYKQYAHLRSHRTTFHQIPVKFEKPHCRGRPRARNKLLPQENPLPEDVEAEAFDEKYDVAEDVRQYRERKRRERRERGEASPEPLPDSFKQQAKQDDEAGTLVVFSDYEEEEGDDEEQEEDDEGEEMEYTEDDYSDELDDEEEEEDLDEEGGEGEAVAEMREWQEILESRFTTGNNLVSE